MAKVKSTIDLIMEKTGHLSLTKEEKNAFEEQQLRRRVQAPVARYLRGERDVNYLAQELDGLPSKTDQEGKRLCLGFLLDGLSPLKDNERVFAAVGRLLGETERRRWEETVAPLEAEYRRDLLEAREHAADRCRKALAALGLKGSALLPRPDEEDPSWKEEQEQRLMAFHARLKTALGNPQM